MTSDQVTSETDREPWERLADCEDCVWNYQVHSLEEIKRWSEEPESEIVERKAEVHENVTGHTVHLLND